MRHVPSVRRIGSRRPCYRPEILLLEERLPLGDGVLGLLVGAALLPAHAAPPAVAEPGALALSVGRIFNPSCPTAGLEIRLTEAHAAAWEGEATAALPAPTWDALTDFFAPAARRQHDPRLASLQHEQGPDQSSLALRAGEDRAAPPGVALAPAVTTPPTHADGTLLALLAALQTPAPPVAASATPAQEAQVKENFGKLPLYFEQNVGQTDASVHFFARGPGYGLYLTATEAVMVLNKPTETARGVERAMLSRPCSASLLIPDCLGRESMPPTAIPVTPEVPPAVVCLQVLGGNPAPAVTGRDEQPGKINYFLGNDPAQWHTNIATFGRVEYAEVYPGINLVYYGTNRQLEYDFVVSPGADPNVIRLNVSGAERVELDAAGDLLVQAGDQTLRQHKPVVYQDVDGTRHPVASRFVLEGQQVRFAVGAYDAGRQLVIDPVLSYSTYLGGNSDDAGFGLAVDPSTGDAFISGQTFSTSFPTANPIQAANRGMADAFVTRLRADGAALVYATYLGGTGNDSSAGLAVDPSTGNVVVMGWTTSTNFPTANPFQSANRGLSDAFVARLSSDGAALVFSTYLGGSNDDRAFGLVVEPGTGSAVVTGGTTSANFPTVNAFQSTYRGSGDAFVARLQADGAALVYASYLGGSSSEVGYGIALDPSTGDVVLTGSTASTNFPTVNPFQPTNRGGVDAYVARLRADGPAVVYATYLGGGNYDEGRGIALDLANGDALVTGWTSSTNFPTANPFQPSNRGGDDAFVVQLSSNGAAVGFATYLGGSNSEFGYGITLDPSTGEALVTGQTYSSDFPIANPFQPANRGMSDAYVARLRRDGLDLVCATYLGGSSADLGRALAVDSVSGDVVVIGQTASTNFPTSNPLQGTNRGGSDAFVTRIGSPPAASYFLYPYSGSVTAGVPIDFLVLALDAQFNLIPDYAGLILFFATDAQATTPVYYQYQRTDRGIASFPGGLTFNTPGVQELYVLDWPGVQAFGYAAFEVV